MNVPLNLVVNEEPAALIAVHVARAFSGVDAERSAYLDARCRADFATEKLWKPEWSVKQKATREANQAIRENWKRDIEAQRVETRKMLLSAVIG
jgi:hypothetical protein